MNRRLFALVLAAGLGLMSLPDRAQAVGDARRLGMGGVLVPGSGLEAMNPAFRGFRSCAESREIPLPLGIAAGLLADTQGMDNFEAAYTRIKAAYPFFEMQLRPESDLSSDITIDVGENSLSIDLGQGSDAVPEGPVSTDFLHEIQWLGFTPGPFLFGVGTILSGNGEIDMDDDLREVLRSGQAFDPNQVYAAWSDNTAQAVGSLEVGARVGLGTLGEGSGSPWAFYAAVTGKGLLGVGYADVHVDGSFVTGDPIFGATNPLEATYVADIRTNDGLGKGWAGDLGVAGQSGPWLVGLSMVNAVSEMRWEVQRRVDVLDENGNTTTTRYPGREKIVSRLPRTWVANAAWQRGGLLLAGDVRRGAQDVECHAGVEKRLGLLALRSGLSWEEGHGFQGAVGAGLGRGFSLDVSLRTQPWLYSEGRGLLLGASVGVPF